MGYWPVVKKVVKDSDVILEILDARMPDLSRNKELERIARRNNKKLIFVFTKIDLVSQSYLNKARKEYKGEDVFFVSGAKNLGMRRLKTALLIMAKREKIDKLKVGIVGYPNVGKSAIINALAKRGRAKVSRIAGTTKGIQWIKAGSLLILDSPGVVPFEDNEIKLGILGAKNPEKIKRLERVVFALIRTFLERNMGALERNYNIKIDDCCDDEYDIVLKIGKARKFLRKGGVIDERRAYLTILYDWQRGTLGI